LKVSTESIETMGGMALATLKLETLKLETLKHGFHMSANTKKSMSATILLILLGMLVLFTGEKSLVVVIPAALFVWYGAAPKLRSGRN
jgi:hypothetical protein